MATTRYRPRNTPIRALQWTGDNAAAMTAFAAKRFAETAPEDRTDDPESTAALLETDHDTWFDLQAGDWVIRRAGGWFGVLDNAEFTDQYEADPEQPAAAPSVPADAELRDRIAQALAAVLAECDAIEADYRDQHGETAVGARAAIIRIRARVAVLEQQPAVLPAPADRAAVLREAADAIVADNDRQMWATKPGKHWAADLLRRKADEAQQPHAFVPDTPRAPGLCATCGDSQAWHRTVAEETQQAEQEPIQLRWGLNDVMWGDDDSVLVMLSGPDREPYWLELDTERAVALRRCLAGPSFTVEAGTDEPQP